MQRKFSRDLNGKIINFQDKILMKAQILTFKYFNKWNFHLKNFTFVEVEDTLAVSIKKLLWNSGCFDSQHPCTARFESTLRGKWLQESPPSKTSFDSDFSLNSHANLFSTNELSKLGWMSWGKSHVLCHQTAWETDSRTLKSDNSLLKLAIKIEKLLKLIIETWILWVDYFKWILLLFDVLQYVRFLISLHENSPF